jgi:hypothetical protein
MAFFFQTNSLPYHFLASVGNAENVLPDRESLSLEHNDKSVESELDVMRID